MKKLVMKLRRKLKQDLGKETQILPQLLLIFTPRATVGKKNLFGKG